MATSTGSLATVPVPAARPPIIPVPGPGGRHFKPGPDLQFNLKNVISVLAKVNYQYLPSLTVELGLEDILGEIDDALRVPDQARKHLAEKWLQSLKCPPGVARWEILANALRSPIVGENRLASDLERWCIRRDSGASTISSSSSEPYSPRSPVSPGSSSTEEKGMNLSNLCINKLIMYFLMYSCNQNASSDRDRCSRQLW